MKNKMQLATGKNQTQATSDGSSSAYQLNQAKFLLNQTTFLFYIKAPFFEKNSRPKTLT